MISAIAFTPLKRVISPICLAESQKRRVGIAGAAFPSRPSAPLALHMIHVVSRQQLFCLLNCIAAQGGQGRDTLAKLDMLDRSGHAGFAADLGVAELPLDLLQLRQSLALPAEADIGKPARLAFDGF